MRVALLYPEVYDMARFKDRRKEFPPFGVLYLAAVIEQAGHDVTVEAVTPSRTRLNLAGYDAVGFSLASSATYGIMLRARRESSLRPARADHGRRGALQLLPRLQPDRLRRRPGRLRGIEETILAMLDRGPGRDLAGIPGHLMARARRARSAAIQPGR